jgi:hypothetical protein
VTPFGSVSRPAQTQALRQTFGAKAGHAALEVMAAPFVLTAEFARAVFSFDFWEIMLPAGAGGTIVGILTGVAAAMVLEGKPNMSMDHADNVALALGLAAGALPVIGGLAKYFCRPH